MAPSAPEGDDFEELSLRWEQATDEETRRLFLGRLYQLITANCRPPGVGPSNPDPVPGPPRKGIVAVLEGIVGSLPGEEEAAGALQETPETSAPPAAQEQVHAPPEQTDAVCRAIALMMAWERGGRKFTMKKLGDTVGTSRATLYRDPHFNAARKALRAGKALPKGSKDGEGNLEAYAPDDEGD